MKWQQTLVTLALLFSVATTTVASPTATPAETDTAAGEQKDAAWGLPEWEVTASSYGGTLLLSDSPEMVSADGILYQDTVSGDVRVFFYHVNATTENKKVVVLLENGGPEPAQVTVYRRGVSGPSRNWLQVGKGVQAAYFCPQEIYEVTVPARGAALLDPALDKAVVEPDMLVNGMYDFQTPRPVTVKVIMLPVKADAGNFAATVPILTADRWRLRGTFTGKDRLVIPRKVYRPLHDGSVTLTLADNNLDKYLTGIDATDGSTVLNYGNYGVVYKLFLPSEGPGEINYALNPRGGEYAGFIGVKYRHQELAPVPTPADKLSCGENTLGAVAPIGTFAGGESLWLMFSPPGASNLPVKLLIRPEQLTE